MLAGRLLAGRLLAGRSLAGRSLAAWLVTRRWLTSLLLGRTAVPGRLGLAPGLSRSTGSLLGVLAPFARRDALSTLSQLEGSLGGLPADAGTATDPCPLSGALLSLAHTLARLLRVPTGLAPLTRVLLPLTTTGAIRLVGVAPATALAVLSRRLATRLLLALPPGSGPVDARLRPAGLTVTGCLGSLALGLSATPLRLTAVPGRLAPRVSRLALLAGRAWLPPGLSSLLAGQASLLAPMG